MQVYGVKTHSFTIKCIWGPCAGIVWDWPPPSKEGTVGTSKANSAGRSRKLAVMKQQPISGTLVGARHEQLYKPTTIHMRLYILVAGLKICSCKSCSFWNIQVPVFRFQSGRSSMNPIAQISSRNIFHAQIKWIHTAVWPQPPGASPPVAWWPNDPERFPSGSCKSHPLANWQRVSTCGESDSWWPHRNWSNNGYLVFKKPTTCLYLTP